MPRAPKGWWDARGGHYVARLGPASETTGKPTAVVLRHEDGRKIGKGEAGAVAAAVRRLLAAREAAAVRGGPTVGEVCRAFVRWHAENGSARATVRGHVYHTNRFAKFAFNGVRYGERPAASVVPEDLWRLKRSGAGAIRSTYASVLACWRWAARPVEGREPARLLAANPLAGVAKPPRGAVTPKLVEWAVTRRLLRFARAWARRPAGARRGRTRAQRRLKVLCLHLIAATGCRPFEACGLRWDELRWGEGVAVVDPKRTKTRGRDRRVAVPAGLWRALRCVRKWEDAHPVYVFAAAWSRARSGPGARELIRWFREELKPAARAAGVQVPEGMTLYWLRHDWQSAGLEVESAEGVAAAAGNSPAVLLSTYAHLKNRRVREVAEAVAKRRRRGA